MPGKSQIAGIRQLVDPKTLASYDIKENVTVRQTTPQSLLNSERLDVMARYIYAKSYVSGKGQAWGAHCYAALLNAWTRNFTLPPPYDPGRLSVQDYRDQFHALINDIQAKGFDPKTSVIPVCQNNLADGAHRLAACLASNVQEIFTVEVQGQKHIQNYETLRRIRLDQDVLMDMVLEFVRLKPDTRMAVLFPVAQTIGKSFEDCFKKYFTVDYTEQLTLNPQGLENLQNLFYGHHDWWGPEQAYNFARQRSHSVYSDVTILFFQDHKGLDDVRAVKEQLRALHKSDKHALHTTDTHAETLAVAQVMLNRNGRAFLNQARPYQKKPQFQKMLGVFSDLIDEQNIAQDVALDTGSVMALHGLRDISDMDYIFVEQRIRTKDTMISPHIGEYEAMGIEPSDILYDPRRYFFYNDVKFVSLDLVKQLKQKRDTAKDQHDVLLIEEIQKEKPPNLATATLKFVTKLKYRAQLGIHMLYDYFVNMLRKYLPETVFRALQSFYKTIRRR